MINSASAAKALLEINGFNASIEINEDSGIESVVVKIENRFYSVFSSNEEMKPSYLLQVANIHKDQRCAELEMDENEDEFFGVE